MIDPSGSEYPKGLFEDFVEHFHEAHRPSIDKT